MKKDFLSLLDITRRDLDEIFDLTDELKMNIHARPLEGKVASLIFQKPSLRTRVSFEVGIQQLGGYPVFLPHESVGIGSRESAADAGKLLSRYSQLIIARVFEHRVLTELAQHATVPVVNALSDLSHPCQVLADLYTLRQHGKLRPGMKVVFVGDGNNVANSWIEMATLYPLHFVLSTPRGFGPDEAVLRYAWGVAKSTVEVIHDPVEAVRGADVIYTDVWTSMGQESEAEERKEAFADYQVDFRLLAAAHSECVIMHCLPAHRGEEITDEVLDCERSIVFDQAENRLHVQKALLTRIMEEWSATRSQRLYGEQCELALFRT